MEKYRKIMATVMRKDPADRKQAIRKIAETMALSVDESVPMVAITDGAATMAALYDLCIIQGIDVAHDMLEIKERVEYLLQTMEDEALEKFPSRSRKQREGGGS